MDTITKLKQDIQALEDSVDEDTPIEELYNTLVQAFYKAKDLAVALEQAVPIVDDSAEIIDGLKATIATLEVANEIYEKESLDLNTKLHNAITLQNKYNAQLGWISGIIHGEKPTDWADND